MQTIPEVIRTTPDHSPGATGALVGLAWIALWLWAQSPYGRYLDHGDWTKLGIAASLCSSVPAAQTLLPATLYVGGWVLMLAAMICPGTGISAG